jgi:LacI family transcriptional regulator
MLEHSHILVLANRNPFSMMRLLGGMGRFALERGGWSFDVVDRDRVRRKRDLRRDVAPADGIVAMGLDPEGLERVKEIARPTVAIHAHDNQLPCVDVDDVVVGRLAGEHLLERGFVRTAYYGPGEPSSLLRRQGLCEAMRSASCPPPRCNPHVDAQGTDWDLLQDTRVIRRWVEALERPVGVLAFNDQLGAIILTVCESLGIDVPDDLAVIGVDNTDLRCEYLRIPLSSVDPNISQLGYEAGRILEAMIQGEDVDPDLRKLPPLGVVTRKSTDTLVTADPEVRRAAAIIRDRACEGLDYDELMESFALSRRSLERRFRAEIGRTLGEEIRRVRLARARDLLARTEMPLADIAARCGFEYMSYLSRAFKKAYGENPSHYRARRRLR